ncbi:MAG TPA: Na(+)-translocating NADH-quinone reductase subunit C [Candidatus Hydrogenedentes bacterium]|nr:Na(+)-translocating NADH-quinone reductase subunit C [Candidatus Hydrogenedentota bacterium]
MQHSTLYTLVFALLVCLVFSVLVSTTAVALRARQERNAQLDIQRSVLRVADVVDDVRGLSADAVSAFFGPENEIRLRLIDLDTGEYAENESALLQEFEAKQFVADPSLRPLLEDPDMSREAPANAAKVLRVPKYALIYQVIDDGAVKRILLPMRGKGLWSTLKALLAIERDGRTIDGITFYEHAETPGLGGEIDNPLWQAKWEGKLAYNEQGEPAIEVVKGEGTGEHEVDGLSGATLTSRGVSNMVQFWLGENGYGPYLAAMGR